MSRFAAIDRKRSEMKRPLMGSTSTGESKSGITVPEDLEDLAKLYSRNQKASQVLKTTTDSAKGWEDSMNVIDLKNANALNAARINGIHDKLVHAHAAAVESVVSRVAIVNELNKLLQSHKMILEKHQELAEELNDKKQKTSEKKTEIENAILAKIHYEKPWEPVDTSAGIGEMDNDYREPERPQVEALTPPLLENDDDEEDDYNPPDVGENGNGSGTPPAMFGFEDDNEEEVNGDNEQHHSKKRRLDYESYPNGQAKAGTLEQDVDDLIRSESGH